MCRLKYPVLLYVSKTKQNSKFVTTLTEVHIFLKFIAYYECLMEIRVLVFKVNLSCIIYIIHCDSGEFGKSIYRYAGECAEYSTEKSARNHSFWTQSEFVDGTGYQSAQGIFKHP